MLVCESEYTFPFVIRRALINFPRCNNDYVPGPRVVIWRAGAARTRRLWKWKKDGCGWGPYGVEKKCARVCD